MGLIRWFTNNECDTDVPTHVDVLPLALPVGIDAAPGRIAEVVAGLRGWRVEVADPDGRAMHLTRRTRVLRLEDDVALRVEPTPNGVRVHAHSKSRIGAGDLGQNRRNVKELFRALRHTMGSTPRR